MKKSVDLNNQNEIGDATSINRLILVGNGFDLAHGMKTSYGDFILWYFRKCWEEAKINYKENILNVRTYKNDLISIEYKVNSSSEKEISTTLDSKNDLNSFIRNTNKFSTFKIKCTFHSNLISLLVKSYTNKNWVDIENAYYEELKRILKTIKELVPSTSDTAIKNLELLNRNFETLKMELQNYLLTIRVPDGNSLIRDEMYCVPEEQISGNAQKLELKNTLILNFNYTSTTNKYANKNSILHIHGDLKNEKNPIIFGYGDERDETYEILEKAKIEGVFTHIKSFDYFKTDNYSKLLAFLESEFDVYIMGHSCGLSDRTLLSTIFEHENCRKIKIFYHDNAENYRKTTYEISRHFTDKALMRERVLPITQCKPMPQSKMED